MPKAFFEDVPEFGDLYLVHTILEHENTPILFICRNDAKETFLCLCSEVRHMFRWVISPTDAKTIYALCNTKLSIYKALTKAETCIIGTKTDDAEEYCVVETSDIDTYDLPKKNTKLEKVDFIGLAMFADGAPKQKKKKS